MTLETKFKQQLKAAAHKLKPVVMIGSNGLTPAIINEINRALNDHELIKIKIAGEDREQRKATVAEICQANHAELVQVIGRILIIYRKNTENKAK